MNYDFIKLMIHMMLCVGSVIPIGGLVSLFRKEQNKTTISLLLSNVGIIAMNCAYALSLTSMDMEASQLAFKIQCAGNAVFNVFFILFLFYYLRANYIKYIFRSWLVVELIYTGMLIFNRSGLIYRNESFEPLKGVGFNILHYEMAIGTLIINVILTLIMLLCACITCFRFITSPNEKERKNYKRLAFAEFIIVVSCLLQIFEKMTINLGPLFLSIAIFVIDMGLIHGDLIRVTDMGREWIFDNTDEAFIIVDSLHRYLDSNDTAKKLYPELRDLPMERLLPANINDMIFDNQGASFEYNGHTYDSHVIEMKDQEDIVGYSIILTDITEHMALLDQLREEKVRADAANQAKSKFVSTISHEIRTPMNAIIGIADILLRRKRDREDTDYLMNIKSAGDALLLIINDILDYSKIEAGQMTIIEDEYNPRDMINDMHMIFVTRLGSKPVEIKYDIMEDLPGRLYGDALRIRQIIINYMTNAIKFTETGSVTLSVHAVNEHDDMITLEFAVSDTGQGIRGEDLDKLFDSFTQVDEKKNHSKEGTGLGLAICKQLTTLMGGTVGVTSTYGKGSRFYARIPQKIIDRAPQESGERKVTQEIKYICPDINILLVDDNEMNLMVAQGLLKPLRANIDTVDNGKKAVEAVDTKKYDIVLMDHMMPVMDGVEATKLIRAKDDEYFKKLPIIALTANVTEEAKEEYNEAGMDAFIAKPILMEDVLRVFKEILPDEKLKSVDDKEAQEYAEEEVQYLDDDIYVEGLNAEEGLEYCGSKELYVKLLGDFYKYIDIKANKIEKCIDDHMLRDYTIEVHALKNTARMIGYAELSSEFKHLEELGNAGDEMSIIELTPLTLEKLRALKPKLERFASAGNSEKNEVTNDKIVESLKKIHDAMDMFDLDGADAELKNLMGYKLPDELINKANELDAMIADVAIEDSMALASEMISMLT